VTTAAMPVAGVLAAAAFSACSTADT
jgi:hypothetical protein